MKTPTKFVNELSAQQREELRHMIKYDWLPRSAVRERPSAVANPCAGEQPESFPSQVGEMTAPSCYELSNNK